MRSHQVVIGTTGTGKTTLLLRLWAGFMATALRRHAAGQGRAPLLVVLDCKGGADARRIADRARRVLRMAGARSTAIWPDEASLSLWALPPDQLTTTLLDLIEHGTGAAAYYADVMEAVVGLAVAAPGGPPASAADLLARLDPGWLALAYVRLPGTTPSWRCIRSAARQIGDIALRFRTLLRRLGSGLDGPGGFGDADAWYCILEGTAEISVAEAQARALVDLLASYATARPGAGRQRPGDPARGGRVQRGVPAAADLAAVRAGPLARPGRPGVGAVLARAWPPTEDERYRIAATADGGIWLLRTPHPEPVAALAGTRSRSPTPRGGCSGPAVEPAGQRRGSGWCPVVDPDLIRGLDVGQAAYIYRGGVDLRPGQAAGGRAGRAAAAPGPGPGAVRPGTGRPRYRPRRRPPPVPSAAPSPPMPSRPPLPDVSAAARRGVRPGARAVSGARGPAPDPFAVLGVEPRADLTDDEVHAAWRRIATATHPDRADGGDPPRFAEAAAAYTALRTRFGRGEALADLRAARPGRPAPWRRNGPRRGARAAARLPGPDPARAPGPARVAGPGRAGRRRGRGSRRRAAPRRPGAGHRGGDLAGADRPPRPGAAARAPGARGDPARLAHGDQRAV